MMLSPSVCQRQQQRALPSNSSLSSNRSILTPSPSSCCISTTALLLLLLSWLATCQGIPVSSRRLQTDQELQFWNEVDDACSTLMSTGSKPQASGALEELCFMVMGILQKSQGLDEKDNNKRFLFHYSKTHDSGNSDIMSVLHPLLQLVPQLHERRMKRFRTDEELQGPGGIQSRGYFLFRPRNGRRSIAFP